MILTIMQDDLLYTFNDELIRFGYAETISLPNRVEELNIRDLDKKFAAQEDNFRRKRVEEYVESCLANSNNDNDGFDEKVELDSVMPTKLSHKINEEKISQGNMARHGCKSNTSQKNSPNITTKSIVSHKPPSINMMKSPISQKPPIIDKIVNQNIENHNQIYLPNSNSIKNDGNLL